MYATQSALVESSTSPLRFNDHDTADTDHGNPARHALAQALSEVSSCADVLVPRPSPLADTPLSVPAASGTRPAGLNSSSTVTASDQTWQLWDEVTSACNVDEYHGAVISPSRIRTPGSIIEDVFNMDETQARAFLDQYCFDKFSAIDKMSLALHLEQFESFPDWIHRYKRPPVVADEVATQSGSASSGVENCIGGPGPSSKRSVEKINSAGPSAPKRKKEHAAEDIGFRLGEEVDSGFQGVVYADKYDSKFLIKVLRHDKPMASDDPRRLAGDYSSEDAFELIPVERRKDAALREAALFCRYYGDGTAFAFSDGKDAYIRMLKIAGTPLSCVKHLPRDALQRYVDMLEKLNRAGIMHGDLHSDNVLYAATDGQFKPIDFSDMSGDYFSGNAEKKDALNQRDEQRWNSVREQIERKITKRNLSGRTRH